jgi:hypothetical protein
MSNRRLYFTFRFLTWHFCLIACLHVHLLSTVLFSDVFGGLVFGLLCFLLLNFQCLPFFYSVFFLLNDNGITTRSVYPQGFLCCYPGVYVCIFISCTRARGIRIRDSLNVFMRRHSFASCEEVTRGMYLDL